MPHNPVAEIIRFFGREKIAHPHLHLVRVLGVGKAESAADADKVGVGHHRRLAVYVSADEVGRFPPDALEGGQLLDRVGYPPPKVRDNWRLFKLCFGIADLPLVYQKYIILKCLAVS